jgi:hypothetical protein
VAARDPDQLVELGVQRVVGAVLGVLDRDTIRKVTIVVEALITSCQAYENPKIGPETAHRTTSIKTSVNLLIPGLLAALRDAG